MYSLVNEHNIRNLTRELLDYLTICDSEFKPDLTAKICMLIQRWVEGWGKGIGKCGTEVGGKVKLDLTAKTCMLIQG